MNREMTIYEMSLLVRQYAKAAKLYSNLRWKSEKRGEDSDRWAKMQGEAMGKARYWHSQIVELTRT